MKTSHPNIQRRAEREARREKQRHQNAGRARKMHDARVEAAANAKPVRVPLPPTRSYYVGCSGWFYWHWRGIFYPENMPVSAWFSHYAGQFATVELNAPFYSWPTISTVKSWLKQAEGMPFVYTVKVCELITHTRRFRGTRQLVEDFGYIADLLGPKMGCFLFQLPPSYHYHPARLKNILGQLDHARRNVVEFRHPSWWNEKVFAAFRKTGTIFCSCSGPRLPDELVKTSDDVYIRFHGTRQWYRHNYSKAELEAWAMRIRNSGATRVWAYFNNDREAHAIENAKMLLQELRLPAEPGLNRIDREEVI
jgi:uncharacterized protein YecE (DUF72 family)